MNVHIEYKGVSYFFKNENGEDSKMFMDRCWFIVKHPDLKEYVEFYINKKHYGVTYPEEIEAKLLF